MTMYHILRYFLREIDKYVSLQSAQLFSQPFLSYG